MKIDFIKKGIHLFLRARKFIYMNSDGPEVFQTPGAGGPSGSGLLMETGDYLLLETGDYILLEA